jgi:hypothetical protein
MYPKFWLNMQEINFWRLKLREFWRGKCENDWENFGLGKWDLGYWDWEWKTENGMGKPIEINITGTLPSDKLPIFNLFREAWLIQRSSHVRKDWDWPSSLASNNLEPQSCDKIPSRILKECAYILAGPIAIIFNKSLSSSVVPIIWKESSQSQSSQSQSSQSQRSINQRAKATLDWYPLPQAYLKSRGLRGQMNDLNGKIYPCQFGCLKGLLTTYCLLDMLHTWFSPRFTE